MNMKDCKLNIGDVVLSKKGRDSNNYFVVVAQENDFVYVADGQRHLLARPKKKNVKHLLFANAHLDAIAEKLKVGAKVFDSEVKSALRQFNELSN